MCLGPVVSWQALAPKDCCIIWGDANFSGHTVLTFLGQIFHIKFPVYFIINSRLLTSCQKFIVILIDRLWWIIFIIYVPWLLLPDFRIVFFLWVKPRAYILSQIFLRILLLCTKLRWIIVIGWCSWINTLNCWLWDSSFAVADNRPSLLLQCTNSYYLYKILIQVR